MSNVGSRLLSKGLTFLSGLPWSTEDNADSQLGSRMSKRRKPGKSKLAAQSVKRVVDKKGKAHHPVERAIRRVIDDDHGQSPANADLPRR